MSSQPPTAHEDIPWWRLTEFELAGHTASHDPAITQAAWEEINKRRTAVRAGALKIGSLFLPAAPPREEENAA